MSLNLDYPFPTKRNPVTPIIPERVDEGEPKNLTIRVPEKILESIEEISESTGWSRTDVILHFMRWAIREYRAEQDAKKSSRK